MLRFLMVKQMLRSAVIFSLLLTFPSLVPGAEQAEYSLVLVPLDYNQEIAGAHGSTWWADLWVSNHSDQPVSTNVCRFPPGCPLGTSPAIPPRGIFLNPVPWKPEMPGVMWFLQPEDVGKLHFNLRLYERTEETVRQGIEVPVVRESQFFTGPLELLAIPASNTARVHLRIYDPDAGSVEETLNPRRKYVRVEILTNPMFFTTEPVLLAEEVFEFPAKTNGLASILEPAVIQVMALTERYPQVASQDLIMIRITPLTEGLRFWAMASVTNNETQYVSIISPH